MSRRPVPGGRAWSAVAAVIVGVLGGAPAAAQPQDARQGVFEPTRVWPVHLTLPAAEYAALQPRGGFRFPGPGPAARPQAPQPLDDVARELHRNAFGMDLPWAKGTVTIENETFRDVGVRYKGNGTILDASRTIKKSFKIDLDHFGGAGRFRGLKTLNLHCGVTDPSKCREPLGYALYRAAGVPAPRTALAEVRLTVPGKFDRALLGVYTLLEQVDRTFLASQFGAGDGLLMKPEGLREFDDRGDDWEKYAKAFAPRRDATKDEAARLIAFARLVHKADDATFRKEIGSYLDVDGYLRFLAATAYVANADSFFVLGHNYYMYLHPKTGRLHFIPWDLDRAFANFPILGSNNQLMDLSFTHTYAGPHRLTDRLLATPEIAERYRALLKELAATAFARDRVLKELATMEAAVKESLDRDTKAAAARKEGAGGFMPGMFGRPPAMKRYFEKRTASLAAQVAGTSRGFVPTGGFGPGAAPKFGDMMAGPMMETMDTNQDEQVSRAEWVAAAQRVFAACEKDKDGKVDQKALTAGLNKSLPQPPEGAPQGPFSLGNFMAGAILKRADADKDSKLTAEELIAAAGAVFDEFDPKKAGAIDDTTFGQLLNKLFPAPQFGGPPPPPPPPPKDKK